MAGKGHESTSSKKYRFSDAFDCENSFDDEGMKMWTYSEDFRTGTREFEPVARKKAG